jgi:hypothetical protein
MARLDVPDMPAKTKIQKDYLLKSPLSISLSCPSLPHKPLEPTAVQDCAILRFPHVWFSEENVPRYRINRDKPKRLKYKTQIIALEEQEQGFGLWMSFQGSNNTFKAVVIMQSPRRYK